MDLHAALCAGRPHPPLACAALPAPRGYPGSAVTRCLRVWAYSLSDRNRTCDAGPYSLHAAQVDYTAYVRAAQPYFCQAVQEQRWYAPVLAALTVFGAWKFISLTIARLFYRLLCWCRRRFWQFFGLNKPPGLLLPRPVQVNVAAEAALLLPS